jgi:pimeloyl-ACP methyl ester carboxylesterase
MIKKIVKWVFRIVLGVVLVIFLYGAFKQWNYDSKVEKQYTPNGQFSDIGHNKIHFKSTVEGDLTFVLIAGLGETMNTWSEIEDELQSRGNVFMYDRSGLGHSEAGIQPRSVDNLATELKAVLENEHIKTPYILVGHSAGGFIARYYAKKYPEDVIGLYLIDPYQEMGKEEFGEWPASYKMMNWSLRNLSWSGIPYFLLPNPPHPTYKTAKAIKTYGQEAYSEDISLNQFAKLDKEVSDLPIYLLTADKVGTRYNDIQKKWHREIVAKYSNDINEHVIIKSGHHIHIDQPEFVIQKLDEFLNKLRTD